MTTSSVLVEPFTTSDGVALCVEEHGSPEASVTVVLIHGWTLTRRIWERVAVALPEAVGAPVRVLRFDLRGHGSSAPGPKGSATIARCADDLAELINERVPHGKIVLAGHSMGGMTLMAFVQRHLDLFRERVAGVALVATACGDLRELRLGLRPRVASVVNRVERVSRTPLSSLPGRHLSARSGWLRPGLRWLLFGSRPAKADITAAADAVAASHPANLVEFRVSLAEHERAEALAEFGSVPTIILAGLADRLCSYAHTKRLAEAAPHAKLWLYGGAGHMLPLERDDDVTRRLAALTREAGRLAVGSSP